MKKLSIRDCYLSKLGFGSFLGNRMRFYLTNQIQKDNVLVATVEIDNKKVGVYSVTFKETITPDERRDFVEEQRALRKEHEENGFARLEIGTGRIAVEGFEPVEGVVKLGVSKERLAPTLYWTTKRGAGLPDVDTCF